MAEIITLSSDEEETVLPPKKKIKLITVETKKPLKKPPPQATPSCIILSDDDDDGDEKKQEAKANSVSDLHEESAPLPKIEVNGVAPAPDCSNDVECMDIAEPAKPSEPQQLEAKPEEPNVEIIAASTSANLNGTSSKNETQDKFYAFLDECIKVVKKPTYQEQLNKKLSIVKRLYEKLESRSFDFAGLLDMLDSNKEKIKISPEKAIKCFCEAYQWLKSAFVSIEKQQVDGGKHEKIIRKLEHALDKVRRRIAKLDEAEVDFDDEENSQYLQAARYKQRASQIYKKLCQYRSEDPNYGRLSYLKLDFCRSKYPEINQALNRKYKNNLEFPTYYDVDRCIRKCVERKELNISETQLSIEIKRCFEALGNLLQKRRKMELLDTHNDYLATDAKDPANENPEVDQKLRANHSEASKRIQEVVDKYAAMQEEGVNPEVSSSSDDSNIETEAEEEENIENN